VGIPTGFEKLDKILFGGLRDGLYVVTGKPGSGKTTLLKNLADRIAGMKIPVIFVSLETSAFELWAKSMARITQSKVSDVLCGRTDMEVITEANKDYAAIASLTWTVEGMGPVPVSMIDAFVYQTVNELGVVPVVIIDYLQRIPVDIQIQPPSQEVFDSYNAYMLKKLSQKYSCPVIVASSLEKPYSGEEDYQDRITGVLYTADVVMNLSSKDGSSDSADDPAAITLQILKNRNGIQGRIPLLFHKSFSFFAAPEAEKEVLPEANRKNNMRI
jgi:replicative DNA helicase